MTTTDTPRSFARPITLGFLCFAVAVALVGRFFVTSPLWLDEALSVNISKLGVSDIFEALRHDGHPPLYYLLLHGWMKVFGDGDHAVRALSGVITIATIPLAYLVGLSIGTKRLAITTALVFALSPYAFRYGSETRMYALLMAEVFAGYLLVNAALKAPRAKTLAGVAAVTGLLLWTHYWSMWLIGAIGLLAVIRAIRAQRRGDSALVMVSAKVIAALGVGGLTFLPWLPTVLYQNEHTGTPWAPSFRVTTLIVTSITEFAGGPFSEAQLGMMLLVVLATIGVFGYGVDDRRIELNFYTHSLAVRPLAVLAATIAIASAVGLVNGMAFAPRYAAVFFPLFAILVALGLEQFRGGIVRDIVLIAFALLSLAGIATGLRLERSQSRVAAAAIEQAAPSAVVLTCPDQLGPSMGRVLDRERYDVFTYPRFEAPELVDWVDYEQRNDAADPTAFAAELLERVGDRPLFIVWGDGFLTLEGDCQQVIDTIGLTRPGHTVMAPVSKDFYEPMAVVQFDAPAP